MGAELTHVVRAARSGAPRLGLRRNKTVSHTAGWRHRVRFARVPDLPGRVQVTWRRGLAVGVIAVLAAVFFTLIGLGSFRGLILGQDLGIFDQAVRAYAHFQTPYIQIKAQGGFNILGDHFSPIIMALVPFYWIWPSAKMLMVAQALLFAGSSFFVGWYGLRRGLGIMAYVVQVAFVLSYGVLSAMLFDFHEVAFGLPILLYALWAFLEKRDGHLIVACVLMCLVKEDMPMYAAGIALALLVTGRRLFGLILGAASVVVTLLEIFVIIPIFSYWGHFAYVGSGSRGIDSFGAAFGVFFQHLFSIRGLEFLLLIAVTAGVGLLRPVMFAVLPTVLIRFMANDTIYLGFRYHYGVLLTAAAIIALIDGWAWLGGKRAVVARVVRSMQAVVVVVLALSELFMTGAPFESVPEYKNVRTRIEMLWTGNQRAADAAAISAQIPDGASVAADVYLVDQIVDRTTVQIAHPNWQDETGKPISADYVWLYVTTIAYNNQSTPWVSDLFTKLIGPGGGYKMIAYQGPFILLQRVGS